jgi:hypothetical protein
MTSMTIYTPITPTYLYIKQHSVTRLYYFGKTTKDPYKYIGSGKYWNRHLKKHDKEHVITLWVSEPYLDTSIVEHALQLSEEYNIVESNAWANLEPENGLNGWVPGSTHTAESKSKMSASKTGKKRGPHSAETKSKMSASATGKKLGPQSVEHIAKRVAAIRGKKQDKPKLQSYKKERERELSLCPNDDCKFLVNRYYTHTQLSEPNRRNLARMRKLIDKKLYNV